MRGHQLTSSRMPESGPRPVMTKEEIAIHVQRSRTERYVRTALFVQSKWFMIGATAAIIVFLIITYLVVTSG